MTATMETRTMTNIIRDGYTQRGYIEAVEGLHESVSFKYRPMLPEDVEFAEAEANKIGGDPRKAVRLIAAKVSQQLIEWDQTEDDGKEAPTDFETVRRLRYHVLNKLYRIIAGLVASDPTPGASKKEQADEVDAIIAEAAGQSPGQEALENAAKN